MKLNNIEQTAGKTIKRACFVDAHERLAITFTDGTYVFVEAKFWGESMNLVEMTSIIKNYMLKDAGVITKEEHEKRDKDESLAFDENRRTKELAELKRLEDKYKGDL